MFSIQDVINLAKEKGISQVEAAKILYKKHGREY